MRYALFWNVTQSRLVVAYRRFKTSNLYHPRGSSERLTPKGGIDRLSWNVGSLKIGQICCPETSVTTNIRCVTSQGSEDLKKVKVTLCHPRRHREGVEIQLYTYSPQSQRSACGNAKSQPLYPKARDPVFFLQESRWTSEPIWTGTKNLAPTVFRTPHHPAPSQSLYHPVPYRPPYPVL
jgi:hypothetical protein